MRQDLRGNALFYVEIRGYNDTSDGSSSENIIPYLPQSTDNANQNKVLWFSDLNNTDGRFTSKTFILPSFIGKDKPAMK
jgi:hypothetical protein